LTPNTLDEERLWTVEDLKGVKTMFTQAAVL